MHTAGNKMTQDGGIMSRKSKFIKLSMLWEDYEITITSAPRSGYDIILYELQPTDMEEIKRRHVAEHDTAIGVLVTWARQVEEGRVRK